MTFWISQGKVATSDRWAGQICKIFMSNFLRISHIKIYLNRFIFDKSYSKIKRRTFLGHSACIRGAGSLTTEVYEPVRNRRLDCPLIPLHTNTILP